MPKRVFVAAVVVAALAVAAWFLSMRAAEGPPTLLPAAPASGVARPDADTAAIADVATAAAAGEGLSEELLRSAIEGEPVRYLGIQVWDRTKDVPAAGAEVFVLDGVGRERKERRIDGSATQGPFAVHWSALAERHGTRFVADAAGRVDAPDVRAPAVVAARTKGGYAFVWLGEIAAEDTSVELVLQPDESIVVRVVDERGEGVECVAVGIGQRRAVPDARGSLAAEAKELESTLAQIRAWMDANEGRRELAAEKLQSVQKEYERVRREAAAAAERVRAPAHGCVGLRRDRALPTAPPAVPGGAVAESEGVEGAEGQGHGRARAARVALVRGGAARAAARPRDGRVLARSAAAAAVAADDTATLRLSATGAHRVTLVVGNKREQRVVALGEVVLQPTLEPIAVPFAPNSLQY
jgi:hypothetical protein